MAARLAERGFDVVGWDRTPRHDLGLLTMPTPSDAVKDADVVVVSLLDGPACREVLSGLAIPSTAVVVNTSTISADDAADLASRIPRYVHAPVLGSVTAAATGRLTLLASSLPEPSAAASDVLTALGEVLHVDDPRTAAQLKLVANGTLASALLGAREALQHADALGLPRDLTLDVLARGQLGALVTRKRSQLDGATGHVEFTVGALAKDTALLADAVQTPVPAASALAALPATDDIAAVMVTPPPDPSVLAPLRAYARGHATGDPSHFRAAFLPTAHIEGVRDGQFVSWTLDTYCGLFHGPAADEETRHRRIDSLTVSGTVATATMTLQHGSDTFTDAFVLLNVDGQWRIANKVYHRSL